MLTDRVIKETAELLAGEIDRYGYLYSKTCLYEHLEQRVYFEKLLTELHGACPHNAQTTPEYPEDVFNYCYFCGKKL